MTLKQFVPGISLSAGIVFAFISKVALSRLDAAFGSPLFYVPMLAAIFMIPFGLERRARTNRILDARKRTSDFLRDLSEYTMYGTPMSEAVMHISRNNYGALNEEVRNLVSSISVGTPVEEAMKHFGDALNDPEIQRFGIILQKSGESGSNTSDVISMVSRFSSQMQLLTDERNSEMKNYNLILMVSFAVFLLVIAVIDYKFFSIDVTSSSGLLFHSAGANLLKTIFGVGIYIEAIGIGIIIGLVKNRHFTTGFMEMGSMLLVSAVLLLLVGGF